MGNGSRAVVHENHVFLALTFVDVDVFLYLPIFCLSNKMTIVLIKNLLPAPSGLPLCLHTLIDNLEACCAEFS